MSSTSLAAYERYRERFGVDPEFIEADRIRDESGCVRRYERTSPAAAAAVASMSFDRALGPTFIHDVRECRSGNDGDVRPAW
jgi:hypothetical protein